VEEGAHTQKQHIFSPLPLFPFPFPPHHHPPPTTTTLFFPTEPVLAFDPEVLGEALIANTKLAGYGKPTPVQKYSIPIGVKGMDLMACAQTGSGKTAGFLFPVIAMMMKRGAAPWPEGASPKKCWPNCLILAPTRELVTQVRGLTLKHFHCSQHSPC